MMRVVLSGLIVTAASSAVSGCDFYSTDLSEDYALCAVDLPRDMHLCRRLSDGGFIGLLEPTVVAAGESPSNISALSCADDGERRYWSVSKSEDIYSEPEIAGPLTSDQFNAAQESDSEVWPDFSVHLTNLERRHCERAEG